MCIRDRQNRFLDFGFGFYTTTNKIQAIGFADKVTKRRKDGEKVVSIYEIDETCAFDECSVLYFESANEAWLDVYKRQRTTSADSAACSSPRISACAVWRKFSAI